MKREAKFAICCFIFLAAFAIELTAATAGEKGDWIRTLIMWLSFAVMVITALVLFSINMHRNK